MATSSPVNRNRLDYRMATSVPESPNALQPQSDNVTHDDRHARLHAIDALRGVAMTLGIALHSAVSYMSGRVPELLWTVYDPAASPVFDALFWWAHAFRLPLFFLIAGFFAALSLKTRGLGPFVRQRLQRLVVPWITVTAVLLPIILVASCYAWMVTGQCTVSEALRLDFPDPEIRDHYFGPAHLWFLHDLVIMTFTYAGLHYWFPVSMARWAAWTTPWSDAIWASRWKPLLCAIPALVMLLVRPAIFASHPNSFWADPWRLAYYGAFFTFGEMLYRYRDRLDELRMTAVQDTASSVVVTIGMFVVLHNYLAGDHSWPMRSALAASVSLVAWYSIFGFLGLFLKYFAHPSAMWRYLADASYWLYLVHLPIVIVAQAEMYRLNWPAGVKFTVVLAAGFGLALLMYQWFVRYTFIGWWLHGPRVRAK